MNNNNHIGKEIPIYDKGKLICSVVTDIDHSKDSMMCLLTVNYKSKKYDVLHILDMDYGIIIPNHIAVKMNKILDKE